MAAGAREAGFGLSTRERILEAARVIIERSADEAVTVKAVAQAAGVSRQAIYLHFSDRAELFEALSNHIAAEAGLADWRRQVAEARDGPSMLRRLAELRAARSSALTPLMRLVAAARQRDETAQVAWRHRLDEIVNWAMEVVVARLAAEGRIHPSWDAKEAAQLLIVLCSFHTWDDLTQTAGWTTDRFVERVAAAALSMLAGDASSSALR